MEFKTLKDIEKLNPIFNMGMDVIEYFVINILDHSASIRSGLKYADDEILSPFNLDLVIITNIGLKKNGLEKILLNEFSEWWNSLNIKEEKLGEVIYQRLPFDENQKKVVKIVTVDKQYMRNLKLKSFIQTN